MTRYEVIALWHDSNQDVHSFAAAIEARVRQDDPALRLVVDIRFALGDDGKRMQGELVEYCKELRRDAALGKAINRACADLPLGWEIAIELENGAGTATLYCDGEPLDIEGDHDSFGADIDELIDAAIDANRALTETQAPDGDPHGR